MNGDAVGVKDPTLAEGCSAADGKLCCAGMMGGPGRAAAAARIVRFLRGLAPSSEWKAL